MRADRGGTVGGPAPSPRSGTVGGLVSDPRTRIPAWGPNRPSIHRGTGATSGRRSAPRGRRRVEGGAGHPARRQGGYDQRLVDRRHRLRHPERWLRSSGPCPTSRMAGTAGLWVRSAPPFPPSWKGLPPRRWARSDRAPLPWRSGGREFWSGYVGPSHATAEPGRRDPGREGDVRITDGPTWVRL